MSHAFCRSMYFQMLSDIKHFSKCLQILLSHPISSGEGTEQKNPFRADLTTLSSRDLNQHQAFMHCYTAFVQSLSCNPHFLQPICMHFLFYFAPNVFTWQVLKDPIRFVTFLFLADVFLWKSLTWASASINAPHTSPNHSLLINHRLRTCLTWFWVHCP